MSRMSDQARRSLVECRGIPHLAKTPDFLSSSAALTNFLRLSLRENRTRVHNGRCVAGNPGSERDVGHPRFSAITSFSFALPGLFRSA
jgi:hypothetical protein